jgi:hypothetical protein
MLRPQFVVVFRDGQWKIEHDGKRYGPFTTEREAIVTAIEAAHRAGCHGHEPRVLVEGKLSERLQTEWTYGDPYPPPDWETFRAKSQSATSPFNQNRGAGAAS